ncbi:hypothetical protein FCM35_KLT17750 [Carex littledalei]|uniref:Uncharacterized protein n=1 Tax=Carex littledalei TaxID=544730 RepID=A0A833RK50_9POAL|nr:hypothetical protein FCM35_KLT17750 [Carex littledalei]
MQTWCDICPQHYRLYKCDAAFARKISNYGYCKQGGVAFVHGGTDYRLQCNIIATLTSCKPSVAFVHKAAYVVHSSMQSGAFAHGTTNICCAFLNAKHGICPRDYKYMLCIPQCKAWHLPTGLQIYVVHSSMQSVAFSHRTTDICCAFLNAKRGICPRDYRYMLCIPQCKAWHFPTGLQIYVVHSSMQSVAFAHGTTDICCAFLNAKRGICPRDYVYMLCIPQCKAWHLPTGLQIYSKAVWHLSTTPEIAANQLWAKPALNLSMRLHTMCIPPCKVRHICPHDYNYMQGQRGICPQILPALCNGGE